MALRLRRLMWRRLLLAMISTLRALMRCRVHHLRACLRSLLQHCAGALVRLYRLRAIPMLRGRVGVLYAGGTGVSPTKISCRRVRVLLCLLLPRLAIRGESQLLVSL